MINVKADKADVSVRLNGQYEDILAEYGLLIYNVGNRIYDKLIKNAEEDDDITKKQLKEIKESVLVDVLFAANVGLALVGSSDKELDDKMSMGFPVSVMLSKEATRDEQMTEVEEQMIEQLLGKIPPEVMKKIVKEIQDEIVKK